MTVAQTVTALQALPDQTVACVVQVDRGLGNFPDAWDIGSVQLSEVAEDNGTAGLNMGAIIGIRSRALSVIGTIAGGIITQDLVTEQSSTAP